MTAQRKPCSRFVRMCSSKVVFPAPRNPDKIVTGKGLLASGNEAIEEGGESAVAGLETDDAAVEDIAESSALSISLNGAVGEQKKRKAKCSKSEQVEMGRDWRAARSSHENLPGIAGTGCANRSSVDQLRPRSVQTRTQWTVWTLHAGCASKAESRARKRDGLGELCAAVRLRRCPKMRRTICDTTDTPNTSHEARASNSGARIRTESTGRPAGRPSYPPWPCLHAG